MVKKPYIIFIGILMSYVSFCQNISNVSGVLTKDYTIVIDYELAGLRFNQTVNVSLYVSRDGGTTFEGPMKEVSGDVGEIQKEGNYQIIWEVIKEMPFIEEMLIFDVRAEVIEERIKRSLFVSYVGNTTTPFGLRIGLIGKVGFYVEGRMNSLAFEETSYEYADSTFIGWDKNGYYQFTGNTAYCAYFIGGGLTFQPARNFFLYLGAGYGKENYLYEIDEYDYGNNSKTGNSYVKDTEYSAEGYEVDIGAMIRIKKVILSAGATTINAKLFNWTAGIGWSF